MEARRATHLAWWAGLFPWVLPFVLALLPVLATGGAGALLAGAGALLVGCDGARPRVPEGREADALARAALDTMEREACPLLLQRTFPLDDPRTQASSGRLWVRRCEAKRAGQALTVDAEVLGWQWAGERSWGFEVREYVYFSALIHASLSARIDAVPGDAATGTRPGVILRVWSDKSPEVHVREIGRVDATAKTPASTLLGAVSALAGRGPNALATSALRARVRDLIAERASAGIPIAVGEAAPVPGTRVARAALLDETESLHPGGALISGSFAPGLATTLRWAIEGEGAALARPVCVDEALALVDAVIASRPARTDRPPAEVVTLVGSGEVSLPALPCRWVLVTGTRDDRALVATIRLAERPARFVAHATRRWVRATLDAYELEGGTPEGGVGDGRSALAVTFAVGPAGALRSFGRALATSRSPAVSQVAPLFELLDGAEIVVTADEQRPRPPSLLNATPGFDARPLGRGAFALPPVAPGSAAASRVVTVPLASDGRTVGWARLVLDALEIP